MKKKIEFIIFDLDGTIIDTEIIAAQTVEKIFTEWKLEIDPKDSAYVTGRTWESAFQYLFQKYKIPVSREEAKKKMMSCYRSSLEEDLRTVPGSVSAIQHLSQHYPLGLVSGSGRAEINWALKKLEIHTHFKIILGAEDYPKSKPHPDGYLKAVQFFQAKPESCLVFEDSTAGIASALSAGLWVVAITSTNHFQQITSDAHFEIPDLTDVTEKWINQLSLHKNREK